MNEVNNDFKLQTKTIRQQNIKLTMNEKKYNIKKIVYGFEGKLFKTDRDNR